MSIYTAIKSAMRTHGNTASVNLSIADKAITADVATKAVAVARTALNKGSRLASYSAVDWKEVSAIVARISAVKLGIHEIRKLRALEDTIKARALIGAECRINLPILAALSEGKEVSVAYMRHVGNDNNHETFLAMLAKGGMIATRKDGRSKVAYSVIESSNDNAVFWQAIRSLCK